jgi:hypothetical protein
MAAGFCWPWSDPNPDGTLIEDVQIGSYKRPWNAKPDAGRLAKGIPKASVWAHDPKGINQVGCVYTAQGFEFDYVGVIFGTDLVYDPAAGDWKGVSSASHDAVVKRARDGFTRLVKNTHRILLTRGMRGCYVCLLEKNTETFFEAGRSTGANKTNAGGIMYAPRRLQHGNAPCLSLLPAVNGEKGTSHQGTAVMS